MSEHPPVNSVDLLAEFIRLHAPQLGQRIDDDTPLIEAGLVDSLTIVQLVAFLERRCHLIVPDEAVAPENFRTLSAIRRMLRELHATA